MNIRLLLKKNTNFELYTTFMSIAIPISQKNKTEKKKENQEFKDRFQYKPNTPIILQILDYNV